MNEGLRPDQSVVRLSAEMTAEESPSEESILPRFAELVEKSSSLLVATDLDGTVVPYRLNPLDCQIDPMAKGALEKLHQNQATVVALTGRSGAEGARLLGIPGAIIVGTAGWEVYKVDPEDPTKGESIIDEKFQPFAKEITSLLAAIRIGFFENFDVDFKDLTTQIETSDGPIVFERKAVNEAFPEGLAINFNFNQVDPKKRSQYIDYLQAVYEANVDEKIRDLMSCSFSKGEGDSPWCSGGVNPLGGEGKDRSLIQLMRGGEIDSRTGEPKRKASYRNLPGGFDGVVFIGDSDQDARALRAAHLAAVVAGRQSLGVVVARSSHSGQERARSRADIATADIAGNAELLSQLATMVERKRMANQ